ncbi:hypothetical protein C1H46_030279 [Malus baccata]|uniref:Uncharacterized protein n=1 Tax=Malus baccata TaxID=106549 RepID=A0A540LCV9_MALBA|nr:hypothetical protein C1H46_030279 [Malus baccata]
MRALRSVGNIRQLFKRLTGVRACDASAAAVEPNVKLSHVNIITASAYLIWKSGRALFKAKESSLKEALKGEICCFSPQTQKHLASLVRQSSKNTAHIKYLELVTNHFAKHGLPKGNNNNSHLSGGREDPFGSPCFTKRIAKIQVLNTSCVLTELMNQGSKMLPSLQLEATSFTLQNFFQTTFLSLKYCSAGFPDEMYTVDMGKTIHNPEG